MKKRQLPYGDYDEIINYAYFRDSFIVKTLIKMHEYINKINLILSAYDYVSNESTKLDTIETKLHLILKSLGFNPSVLDQ